ncbi:MAG: hypothetical protein ACR2KL_06585 [Nocardioidaceae bacterium]
MDIGPGGRLVRLLVTVVLAAGILAGSLWGSDDDFPFGPFSMYSTSRDLDEPVADTVLRAHDASGAVFDFDDTDATGIRRAEIEGQLDRIEAHPELLGEVADAYEDHHPDAPEITALSVVIHYYELKDGRATGASHDDVVVTWRR